MGEMADDMSDGSDIEAEYSNFLEDYEENNDNFSLICK